MIITFVGAFTLHHLIEADRSVELIDGWLETLNTDERLWHA